MDDIYYSDKTTSQFIMTELCQKDRVLYKYYMDGQIGKFRQRFARKYKTADIDKVIYTVVTNTIRDIILETVANLTVYMKTMGDLIITGGEAFNTYFDRADRIPTSDIDTKFVPVIKGPGGKLVGPKHPKFFEYFQVIKLVLWNKLGEVAKRLNKVIPARIETLKKTTAGKILGLGLSSDTNVYVTRRYTVLPKKRQDLSSPSASARNILIDVELFALDLHIRRFSFPKGRLINENLGGILDIAVMRPFEVGYEVVYSRDQGHTYYNPFTRKVTYNKRIMVAGKRFLIEDLFLMKSLGLRPLKVKKDRKRMYLFAKNILKVRNIDSSTSDAEIFRKAVLKIPKTSVDLKSRPVFGRKLIEYAKRINPYKYEKYTTEPIREKLVQRTLVGVKAPRGLDINGYYKTSGIYRFDIKSHKWVSDRSQSYIKDEYTHRPVKLNKIPTVTSPSRILYGFNPARNRQMSRRIVRKSAVIPVIGLKNRKFLKFKK